jgi:multimeric flavodoxin WrbA
MKNILILKGSPRERGNSSVLADQLAAGVKSTGAKVESVYLQGLDIRTCDAEKQPELMGQAYKLGRKLGEL